jgi:nucleotide-binding universal stress UspA family protein
VSGFAVRRLLVALDASAHSLAALEAAVRLAARLGVPLEGLFVEDEDVLRWAALPFGRVIDPGSAAARSTAPGEMERELRAQAERARAALEKAASRARVRFRFSITRGSVSHRLIEAAGQVDLTCLGRSSWARSRGPRLGSTARALAAEAGRALLLLSEGESIEGPVAVLHADSPAGRRAADAAATLADHDGGRLILLVPPGGPDAPALLAALPERPQLEVVVREIPAAEPGPLAEAVRHSEVRLLVLPVDACRACDEGLPAFLEAAPCPVLSVG